MRLQQFFGYYLKGEPEPEWMIHGIPFLDKPGAVIPTDVDSADSDADQPESASPNAYQ
jgi:hypothetical protein